VSGPISFTHDAWAENSSITRYVFDFVISRLPEGPQKAELQEWEANNVLLLDLSDPDRRNLVELLALKLPQHTEETSDPALREDFRLRLTALAAHARRQLTT
jgi:hypothetical protein